MVDNVEDHKMCAVLELGIGEDGYNLLKNICEDEGVEVVDKETMSIILDVYDNTITDTVEVPLQLYTEIIELELEGTGEDAVLTGSFPAGEAAVVINGLVDGLSRYHDEDEEEEEEEEEDDDGDEWDAEDQLTFVIATGEIDVVMVERIQGKLNTVIARQPLTFDEGDVVNMTYLRLGDYNLD